MEESCGYVGKGWRIKVLRPFPRLALKGLFNMNMWFAPVGTTVEVATNSYTQDYQVMLQQLYEELDTEVPETVTVCVRQYNDFKEWATTMPPDYDRYTYDCVDLLVRQKELSDEARYNYDSPEVWKQIRDLVGEEGERHIYELGQIEYINKLALSIVCGYAPPLIAIEYSTQRDNWFTPADGRHRTLAAISLGLIYAPVIELA